jgi:serine/threonine protein kinase
VFRAYDAERERVVAVKLFTLDLPPERVHQLVAALDELVSADLSHPTIVAPLAAGISDVSAYLAEELVPADSLDLAVRQYGPAPPADAVRVVAHLAGALDFAAIVDIAHGALHPRDVLISTNETRLTGLGIGRALERVGVAAPIRRPYTAPERVNGASWDRRADVFSLAVLAHELLWARRLAGTGAHAADALTEIGGGELSKLKDLFARALADDPADRFTTALEFAEALKAAFPSVSIAEPGDNRRSRASSAAKLATAKSLDVESRLPLDEALPLSDAPLRAPDPFEQTMASSIASASAAPLDAADMFEPDDLLRSSPPAESFEPTIDAPPPISVLERSRSAVWPLIASLAVGLAIGFAGGYGAGSRERLPSPPSEGTIAQSQTTAVAQAGRDATEVAVGEPARPKRDVTGDSNTPQVRSTTDTRSDGREARPKPDGAAESAPIQPKPETAPGNARVRLKPATTADNSVARREPNAGSARRSAPTTSRSASSDRQPGRLAQDRMSAAPGTRRRSATEPASTVAESGTAGSFIGALSVDSRPTGARVFLDGKLIGTTPLAVSTVRAGEHVVRLERDGYRRWSSSVRVVASEQNRVTASLER